MFKKFHAALANRMRFFEDIHFAYFSRVCNMKILWENIHRRAHTNTFEFKAKENKKYFRGKSLVGGV